MTDQTNISLAEEVARLTSIVGQLQQRLRKFEDSSQYTFQKDIQLMDGRKLILGGAQGSKIGLSTSKIGLYGVVPVVQASSINAPTAAGATYDQTVAASAVTAINSIRTALKNLGITL